MEIIKDNLREIEKNIELMRKKLNINYKITLIAVSKRKPVEDIIKALSVGQFIFGENRIQEAIDKIPQITNDKAEWHYIGHLQTNKTKKAVEIFDVIHSIDKLETALEVSKRCEKIEKVMPIFIQVNTTGEEQKSGVEPEELTQLLEDIKELPNIKIIGLMTMGPLSRDLDETRKSFQLLRQIRDDLKKDFPFIESLSMGMSGDYEIAIEEGATHIRVGTSIFGKRESL